MNQMAPAKFGTGAAVRRKEDAALIQGKGAYTADFTPQNCLHAFVMRSQMAHARFVVSNLDEAKASDGVRMVWTAADIADLGPIPCDGLERQPDGSMPTATKRTALASGVARHVGDPVAFIVADTIENAQAAADLLEVDYDALDIIVEAAQALDPDAPLVWPELGTNLANLIHRGDQQKTDAEFARADKIAKLDLTNNRLVCNYMETRACLSEYDESTGRFTVTMGTQGGHSMRDFLCNDILKVEPARMRIITPDVGGGFGPKAFVYPEYPLVIKASETLATPIKWVGDRSEHFLQDAHGRDNVLTAELAIDEDGRFLALRVDLVANMGAYLSQYAPFIPYLGITMATGCYDIPVMDYTVKCVYTNTVPVDAYRGAGRPEAAYHIERLVNEAARITGLAPEEIRRRNFVKPEQMPYRTPGRRTYDTGDFAGQMDAALAKADYAGFETRRQASAAEGKYRGFGFATYVEACAFAGSEEARIELNEDGSVTLLIGTQSNGQGHETAYAQFIAGHLGLDYDKINVVQGDTDRVRQGEGTGGSRSIPLGAVSVEWAAKSLAQKIKEKASDELEVSAQDLELQEGVVRVVGTDRQITLAEIAQNSSEQLFALEEFKQNEATYPNGTHAVELEIDPQTGVTKLLNYTIVDDFGVTVNPMLLAGQIHGGVVQGIGQALLEHTVYDEDGQLLSASFLDYCMPRADDVVDFNFETRNVPSKTNALGIKGAGEAGSIGSCPAIMNAVVDALMRGAGITHFDMPATPSRVWEALQAA
ncbi:xanthine dehydrogenase family protein molybdopterin-binding subunit [Pararhizobium sp. IMCC21322]|uniref:xanthine dehydrogenase family protein molybdopterin-binding subunit n=1 Tax=Pararhizobium sp. IMCC21322 TaxID=3067903 RepID=UPI002740BC91|nr:xanthine dehydrogenase family protein molybdopterin-binding subunit [Pararhizobium sp. IMCC21322]